MSYINSIIELLLMIFLLVNRNIVDGAPAARFITKLKELIESGYKLAELEENIFR